MTTVKPVLVSVALACGLCAPASVLAAPAIPTAAISSTTGSGSNGCVASTKLVRFTIATQSSAYATVSARVTLDGKLVDSRNYAVVTSVSNGVIPVVRTFTSLIKLNSLHAGRHTLKLVGVVAELFGRRVTAHSSSVFVPAVPPSTRGTVTETKTIAKCAPKRSSFTG